MMIMMMLINVMMMLMMTMTMMMRRRMTMTTMMKTMMVMVMMMMIILMMIMMMVMMMMTMMIDDDDDDDDDDDHQQCALMTDSLLKASLKVSLVAIGRPAPSKHSRHSPHRPAPPHPAPPRAIKVIFGAVTCVKFVIEMSRNPGDRRSMATLQPVRVLTLAKGSRYSVAWRGGPGPCGALRSPAEPCRALRDVQSGSQRRLPRFRSRKIKGQP